VHKIIKEERAGDYKLIFRRNSQSNKSELVVKHLTAGKHFSIHRSVQLMDREGNFLKMIDISNVNVDQLFLNIKNHGTTEGLYLLDESAQQPSGDLVEQPIYILKSKKDIKPSDVRHKRTIQETSFTATGEKLDYHWPIFKKYKETGFGSIVRATMTNHQVCMSHCQYCSTIARNKKDSISLEEAKDFVTSLYDDQADFNRKKFPQYNDLYRQITGSDIRLKGLILSGGGQPNLWEYFEEFVEWLSRKDISLGLITNGFPRKISEKIYTNFDWVRISITPEDASPFYPDKKFNLQYVPETVTKNPLVTLGLSYVYGPWTNREVIKRIQDAAEVWGAEYVRLLTDCNLTREVQLTSHQALSDELYDMGITSADGAPTGKIFHQLKFHGSKEEAAELWEDGQCYLQTFNVFWDTTGHEEFGESYCYPCDSVTVLAESQNSGLNNVLSERKFNSAKWGTVRSKEVYRLFTEKVHPFFDPREQCGACLFMDNNRRAKKLSSLENYELLSINERIKHVNFP
jgi:organic radical activating enzyme